MPILLLIIEGSEAGVSSLSWELIQLKDEQLREKQSWMKNLEDSNEQIRIMAKQGENSSKQGMGAANLNSGSTNIASIKITYRI